MRQLRRLDDSLVNVCDKISVHGQRTNDEPLFVTCRTRIFQENVARLGAECFDPGGEAGHFPGPGIAMDDPFRDPSHDGGFGRL